MPWGRIDDRLAMSVKIRGLADPGVTGLRAKKQRAEALGVWAQLLSWVSGERSDGFLTADILDLFGWPEANNRLLRARFDRAPLLHERSPDGTAPRCPCLDGRSWPADYEYAMHDYLDRNPSRSENDVHRAKKRELRNAALKRAARDRDQDCCRYCGKHCSFADRVSDDGLTFDHVDPEVAAGLDNLVVACRGCNNRKNRRTPSQADMELLPPPTTGPVTVTGSVASLVTGPVTGPVTGLGADLSPDQQRAQVPTSPGRDGAGAVTGPPGQIGPPDTPRGARSSSPYNRPRHHAGHPREATHG